MPAFRFIEKIFFTLTISVFLAGCNLPSPKEKKEDSNNKNTSATFTAQAMADGSKAMETMVNGNFALPSSKVFNLKACLKDVAYDKPIAGHDFLIEEIGTTVTSDHGGCISWPEKTDFNYLAESQYILISRHIVGKGIHRGSQVVSFAINPWDHGETLPAVLDPNDNKIEKLVQEKDKIEQALKGYSEGNLEITRPLWIEDARLNVVEKKMSEDGITLDVNFQAVPSIKLTKMNGENFFRPLTNGKFQASLKIIHSYRENDKEIRRLLAETPLEKEIMENGSLIIKSSLKLPVIATRGQLLLGVDLQPLDGPHGIKAFQGVYLMGEYDQIKGNGFLKISPEVKENKDFKISNFVTNTVNDIPLSQDKKSVLADSYQKPKVETAALVFNFLRTGQETTSSREIIYNIKACLSHGLDQKNIRAQTFKVTKFRQSDQESAQTTAIKTDHNSTCINWDESYTYNYNGCNHYIKGFVLIENEELGMKEKIEMVFNPWEKNSLDARDLRFVDSSIKLPLTCQGENQDNRAKTSIKIPGYSYSKISYDYIIDKYLNLTAVKKVQLTLEPRLLTYSSLANGRTSSEKLRDGFYLLKTLVAQNKDYDPENSYITSQDKIVTVTDGRIETEITFQTQDLKALGNNNNFLLEIYPIDESKIEIRDGSVTAKNPNADLNLLIDKSTGLVSPTFIGTIVLNNDDASRSMRLMDPTFINEYLLNGQTSEAQSNRSIIQTIVQQGIARKANRDKQIKEISNTNSFAKDNNLDLISLAKADPNTPLIKGLIGSSNLSQEFMISREELRQIIATGKLSVPTAHKLCEFWALDYFRVLNREKGGSVIPQAARGFANNCRKNVDSFFKIEKQIKINEIGKAIYFEGNNGGISVGSSFSYNKTHSKSKTSSHSIGGKLGFGGKIHPYVDAGIGYTYSMSWTDSDSDSSSNSVSVNENTSLYMLQHTFKIPVKSYEQCAIVRLNPSLFIKGEERWFGLLPRRDYLGILNPQLTADESATATSRGLMICSGVAQKDPFEMVENYYVVSQDSPSQGHSQDSGDARNRNFFAVFRSTNDYKRFLLAVRGAAKAPETSTITEENQDQLLNRIRQIFNLPGPSYPGFYLLK